MRSEKEASNQRLKQQAIEKAYLLYYNKVLFEKGLISKHYPQLKDLKDLSVCCDGNSLVWDSHILEFYRHPGE